MIYQTKEEMPKALGANLRTVRFAANISQQTAADRSGISLEGRVMSVRSRGRDFIRVVYRPSAGQSGKGGGNHYLNEIQLPGAGPHRG